MNQDLNNKTNESNNNDLNNLELNNNNNINYQNNSNMNNQVDSQSGLNNSNFFNQTTSQQYGNTQYQNINNQQTNYGTSSYNQYQQQKTPYQPIGSNESVVETTNTPKQKTNMGLIIGIVITVIIVVLGIILLSKLSNKNENKDVNNEKAGVSEKAENTTSKTKQLIVYLNNLKITLGETTMDEIVKNTDLKIIKDETYKSSGYTSDENRENVIEYNKREVVLSDDINVIVIESYFEKTNIVGEISTLRNHQVDDPAFDNSKGTTLSFEDNIIGKRMNIGDTFTQDEFYNDLSVGYCYGIGDTIYCPQTKHLSDDKFIYYFDDNYKIVNMSASLMGYYG